MVVAGLVVAGGFYYSLDQSGLIHWGGTVDLDQAAKAGSFLAGTSGVCWALAGVFFFIAALRIQSKEIKLQVDEMSQTKDIYKQQSFEMTFFTLLSNIEKHRESYDYEIEDYISNRIALNSNIYSDVKEYSEHQKKIIKEFNDINYDERLTTEFEQSILLMRETEGDSLNFPRRFLFSTFNTVLELINNHSENQQQYLRILLSSLTIQELNFVIYWKIFFNRENLHLIPTLAPDTVLRIIFDESHLKYFK